jgi:hypothetical protein
VDQGIEPAIADVFDTDAVKAVVRRAQPEVVIERLTALPRTYTREHRVGKAGRGARRLVRPDRDEHVGLAAAHFRGVVRGTFPEECPKNEVQNRM